MTPTCSNVASAVAGASLATLMLSQGVPMLLGGDELSKTQQGNNNTYCQDNELNWYDWDLTDLNEEFPVFMQDLIGFRKLIRRSAAALPHGPAGRIRSEGCHPGGIPKVAKCRGRLVGGWFSGVRNDAGQRCAGPSRPRAAADPVSLLLFCGGACSGSLLPEAPDGDRWKIVFSTAPDETKIDDDGALLLKGQSVVVLQPAS
jgi:hypothetical protein